MKKIFKMLSSFIEAKWKRRFKTRKELEIYQKKEVEKHLKYLKEKSPYFRRNDFKADFMSDKKFVMENFDELNTLGIKKDEAMKIALESERTRNFDKKYKKFSVGLSSGTSGHRGIFVTTDEEQAIWAGTILAKMLPERKLTGHRIAFFLRADNGLYKSVNSSIIRLKYFDTFENVDKHIDRLNKFNPNILIAPASMLILLGDRKKQSVLNISPEKIISVAEILEKKDEEYISECFGNKIIHQIYQATEGFLGCTCPYGSLHLNEDIIKFEKEYIDDKRFYPIITDFKRTSQPFIRYRLNDILIENNEPCKCGSVFQRIERIEGRSDDIFKFIDRDKKTVTVFPDFIRRCILFVEEIREYQVFQTEYDCLEIAVPDINEKQKKEICKEFGKLFNSVNVENVKIKFIEYTIDNKIKLKRICQKMKKEV